MGRSGEGLRQDGSGGRNLKISEGSSTANLRLSFEGAGTREELDLEGFFLRF